MNTLTIFTVPVDHPAFTGHFPGMPILPGVVLLDSVIRAIGDTHKLPVAQCTINSLKFLHPALPGDVLTIDHTQADNGLVRFDISTTTHKIASGSINLHMPI